MIKGFLRKELRRGNLKGFDLNPNFQFYVSSIRTDQFYACFVHLYFQMLNITSGKLPIFHRSNFALITRKSLKQPRVPAYKPDHLDFQFCFGRVEST